MNKKTSKPIPFKYNWRSYIDLLFALESRFKDSILYPISLLKEQPGEAVLELHRYQADIRKIPA